MPSEFALIRQYFDRSLPIDGRADGQADEQADQRVVLGIGDDCALLQPRAGMQLAVSTDMLVEGRHFFKGTDAGRLGHKSLAVNLSDLAAMGAAPLGFTLALALPHADPAWLENFSRGLLALADLHACPLVGGDTTAGPLTISITVFGEVPPGAALRRDGAGPGDEIWISGSLGDARMGLAALRAEALAPLADAERRIAVDRLERPTPRLALGLALRGVATSAIDLSDGLTGDIGHVLARSRCGATIAVDTLPVGDALRNQPVPTRRSFSLAGGDDYELCFTAPAASRDAVLAASKTAATPVTCIGVIDAAPGLRLHTADGKALPAPASFDHFPHP